MSVLQKRPEVVVFAGESCFDECAEWHYEDIRMLTAVDHMLRKNLN